MEFNLDWRQNKRLTQIQLTYCFLYTRNFLNCVGANTNQYDSLYSNRNVLCCADSTRAKRHTSARTARARSRAKSTSTTTCGNTPAMRHTPAPTATRASRGRNTLLTTCGMYKTLHIEDYVLLRKKIIFSNQPGLTLFGLVNHKSMTSFFLLSIIDIWLSKYLPTASIK